MKNVKSVVRISVIVALGGMYHASAIAASANGNASAQIVAPVTVSEDGTQTMNFGALLPASVGGGNTVVSLSAAATTTRTLDSGVGALVGGATVQSGKFNVTGEAGKVVDISIVDGTADLSNGTDTLTFGTPTVSTATMTIAGDPLLDTFFVGGTLTIPEAVSTGTYTSAAAYTVTVNYQ